MANVTVSKLSDGTNIGYFASQSYFECDTASSVAAKVATSPDNVTFTNTSLVRGTTVHVKFKYRNGTSNALTLQIGTSTAKPMSLTRKWEAGSVVSFTYDGTNWVQNDAAPEETVQYVGHYDPTDAHGAPYDVVLHNGKTINDIYSDISSAHKYVILQLIDSAQPASDGVVRDFVYAGQSNGSSHIDDPSYSYYYFTCIDDSAELRVTTLYAYYGDGSYTFSLVVDDPIDLDKNTEYTFTSGTNGFTVTPSGGTAQTVTVTPSIANNVTGTGTSGSIAQFDTSNTITSGPAFDSNDTDKHLRHDGTWVDTAYRTSSIPYGHVDATSTSTAYTATIPGITELRDGVCVWLKNGVVTSEAGFTININGLGAKPSYSNMAAATADTTLFNVNYTFLFIYDSTRVSGGCWVCYRGYDSNSNTIGYQLRTNSMSLAVSGATYRYRILFTSADGTKYVPANTSSSTNATSARAVNQTPIDPFGDIRYYSSTTALSSGSRPGTSSLWEQYTLTLGYSFNRTGSALTMTSWKPVYVKCAPQADGSAVIDADNPFVQALPSTEDGKIYIFLGVAYSATAIELLAEHPVYCYKNGGIRKWVGQVDSAQVIKNTTDVTIATSDVLPVFDNSDSNSLKGSIAFDTTDTTHFLRKDGTWATAGATYTGGNGIDITSNTISVDTVSGGHLSFDANNKLQVDVDNALSSSSTNPVQNSVLKTELDKKIPKATIDIFEDTSVTPHTYTITNPSTVPEQIALLESAFQGDIELYVNLADWDNSQLYKYSAVSTYMVLVRLLVFINLVPNGLNENTFKYNGTFNCFGIAYVPNSGGTAFSTLMMSPISPTHSFADISTVGYSGNYSDLSNTPSYTATGLATNKTITALSQSDGLISATASNIAITSDQVTKYSTDATIATGDKIGIFDSDDSSKLKSASITFDTSNTTNFLREDGQWGVPSIDTSTLFPKTGGEITGDVTLLKSGSNPGNSYSIILQRGTLTDNYNDWRIQDRGGFLYFDQRGLNSSDWDNQVYFNTTGDVYATTFRGSGANLTSLNASNISSGTLDSARLPSGLEYTTNKVTSISSSSTDDEYPSAKLLYDSLGGKENKGKITVSNTEYTVTRKALVITDGNGNTTTYYVADITQ